MNPVIATRMMELSNHEVFPVKFTRDRKDTLAYVFAAQSFLEVNAFKDEAIRFARIYNTLPNDVRQLFMLKYSKNGDDDFDWQWEDPNENESKCTVENLFRYLFETYPPPPLKHEFVRKLKSDIQRRNEDPLLVFKRYLTKLKKMQRSIKMINKGRKVGTKIKYIQPETQLDALKGIFIRKNNSAKYNNKDTINRLTVKYITSKDPGTIEEWNKVFKNIRTELISDMFDGMEEYQYISYDVSEKDFEIYYSKSKPKQTGPKAIRERQKRFNKQHEFNKYGKRGRNHNNKGNTPTKRYKKDNRNNRNNKIIKCFRCKKNGHTQRECHSVKDINGNWLNDGQVPVCNKCNRPGHKTWKCYATTYADGTPMESDGNNNNSGNNNRPSNPKSFKSTTRSNFELNTLNKIDNNCKQLSETINVLRKSINNNNHINADDLGLFNNLVDKMDQMNQNNQCARREWTDM